MTPLLQINHLLTDCELAITRAEIEARRNKLPILQRWLLKIARKSVRKVIDIRFKSTAKKLVWWPKGSERVITLSR